MGDLVDVSPEELITSQRQNDINDYIEDGTHKVNTLSLNIGGTEVIDSSRNITTTGTVTSGALTSGRVLIAGADGLITDFANFSYNGTQLSLPAVKTNNIFSYTGNNNPVRIGGRNYTLNTNPRVLLGDYNGAVNSATTGDNACIHIETNYNQASGDAGNTDLLIDRTETAVGSGTQLLINAKVDTVSKFSVDNAGNITTTGTITVGSTTLTEQNLIDLLALLP